MANVFVKFLGSAKSKQEASTLDELKEKVDGVNCAAIINGTPTDGDAKLNEGDYIILARQVKGNAKAKIILETPELTLVKVGIHFFLNGVKITKGKAEKLAIAIMSDLGYELE